MPWRDWSDYRRAQAVNAVTVPLFLILAVSMWVQDQELWAGVFAAAALVNIAGGLWRARQESRRSREDRPDASQGRANNSTG